MNAMLPALAALGSAVVAAVTCLVVVWFMTRRA